jgi:hypothetical protein
MNYLGTILSGFIASTVAGFVLPFALAAWWQRSAIREIAVILLALALIGACAGTAGGMSRVGAVGSIIPAFLGLLGALSIYLFGIDRSKGVIASFGAAAISVSLIVSYSLGSEYRNIGDDHRDIRSYCAKAYTDAKLLADLGAFTRFRDRLGRLCDASMVWHLAGKGP